MKTGGHLANTGANMMGRIVLLTAACIAVAAEALAGPIIDGKFDPAEGYTSGFNVNFTLEGGGSGGTGQLWLFQDPVTKNVSAAFIQPKTLVDNSYGTTAVGWGANAPSGKNHNFDDLKGSDKAQFQFKNGGSGAPITLDIIVDYISDKNGTPSGFGTLGVTGGDGGVKTGSASSVLAAKTSLDYNLNVLSGIDGFTPSSFTTNSPTTACTNSSSNACYALNPNTPANASGWIFEVVYELQIAASVFGLNGANFAGKDSVMIPLVHDSPNKLGKNGVTTQIDGPIVQPPQQQVPEPSSLLLLAMGLAGAGVKAWRQKRA